MKKKIGITGGIATGKSTVTRLITEKGYTVIDADQVVRDLQAPGGKLYNQIMTHFGPDFFLEDGQLDRRKLGALIFTNDEAKAKLSSIQDHIIDEAVTAEYHKVDAPVVFMDIPLMYERHLESRYDEIWVVYVTPEQQLQRLMARNNFTQAEAQSRIDAQIPIDQKRKLADCVIDNTGDLAQLDAQVTTLLAELKGR
jgi:dephospho-CoA kinase